MFERAYQGAPSLEILNPQSVNPIGLWKVVGSVQRVFDKALRGHVYQLMSNGAQTTLQLPKEDKSKQGLGLVQPCLVLQVFLPQNREKPFAVEVGVTDSSRSRRRLLFSAVAQEAHAPGFQSSAVHVRLPLIGVRRGTWLNLCLDMDSLVRGSFGQVMKSLDSICIHAECRLRRIFTMRSLPQQSEVVGCVADANCECEYEQLTVPTPVSSGTRLEPIPRSQEFPAGVDQHTQLLIGEQVGISAYEMLKGNGERLYSNALSDAPHALLNDFNHDVGKTVEEESEDCGGVTTCRKDVNLEPLLCLSARTLAADRLANALAPLSASNSSADPVGYEEMIRKAGEAREEKNSRSVSDSHVGVLVARQNTMVVETNCDRPDACTLPEAGRNRRAVMVGSDKAGKSATTARPVTRDAHGTKGQGFQAASLSATAPRRKSQRRPGDLSMVQTRNASDPCCRRFPGTGKTTDRSPSNPPSNHRVRQPRPLPLEIGAPRAAREDGSTSAPCSGSSGCGAPPSSARRGRRPGARLPVAQQSAGEKGENESISPTPSAVRRRRELAKQTLHKMAEIYGVHKHASSPKGTDRGTEDNRTPCTRGDEARELQVEDDEAPPPTILSTLEVLPEPSTSICDVSAVLQAAIALAPREPSIGSASRRPHVLDTETYSRFEGTDDGPTTPASSATLASPSRALAAKLEVTDEIIHDEVADLPADAWAFESTVRHHHSCWPPLGARFRGAHAHDNGAWANGDGRGNPTCEARSEECDRGSLPERSQASGSPSTYSPPQRRALLGEGSLEGDRHGDIGRTSVSSVEDSRRIKSSSPPRQSFQRHRPHPISGLEDSLGHRSLVDPSAPSSAPSDSALRNLSDGCTGQEDGVETRKQSFEVLDRLLQQRPFTPPVVPVGKLLRGVYDFGKNIAPSMEFAARDSSLGCSHHQGPPGVLETSAARSKTTHVEVKDRSTSFSTQIYPPETVAPGNEQLLEAIYDPVLDVYYDPVSNKYYERRRDTSDLLDVGNNLTA
mmetsp:Transcript_56290/g.89368  ORF Transcript_56290/g.89368 Transcript_56290/m.89368 type:complete len:1013 (+) Transcript_56290:149-3187(+)|eukprot:CAMPEP_0169230508 /NCGR_PEP_ID=MMETSP1016-20121227/25969_1 /TAXON_ID=342587 /ORGANISM="Karlodinium micrum, Strain CCMP2283" /LENGTH=1012 /DNA_ID=CAMNT_0009309487 /DNA_START=63 /DNA_END=3101 /DNA_ORIENTATION=-